MNIYKKMSVIIFFIFFLIVLNLFAGPPITKDGESLLTNWASPWYDDRYGDGYLNCMSYQQDAIVSFNGWQYAVYYNGNRNISVKRRQLPNGAWEYFTLTDYTQTTDDNHNTISIGISPVDGRIHLAFDHHDVNLNYRVSVSGLALNPSNFTWNSSLFGSVQENLGGSVITPVTYPRFITAPNGTFLFECRIGQSGSGESWLWRYNNNGTWTQLGKFVENSYSGGECNAYFHGFSYDSNNRLHTVWCWRETAGGNTNHDLNYAYSDDHGSTWRNNSGNIVAITGSYFITQDSDVRVWTIAQDTGLINQEGMAVDEQGRVHVINRKDVSGYNKQIHYWRDTSGVWHEKNTGITTKIWDNRSKIVYDSSGNVYAIMPNLQIASASVASNYDDWTIINIQDDGRFYHSEPLIDPYALKEGSNTLYVYAQEGTASSTSNNIYVIKYTLNQGQNGGVFDPNENYKIINRNSGKVLTISGDDKYADGARIQQFSDTGADYQRWKIVDRGNGYYSIISVYSGDYMDIVSASTADGAHNIQWPDNGGYNQQWQIVDMGNGYYKIINRNSGKLLDISGASLADGAQNIQWPDNGGYNQHWQIVTD